MERRARLLSANPLCCKCQEKGIVSIAREIDHIIPLHVGGPDTDDNTQNLCIPCHVAKTKQDGSRRFISHTVDKQKLRIESLLRPASLPLLSLFGITTGALLGGAVLVETIFSLPGLGRLTVDSITNQDYLLVQGIVLFITVTYIGVNFVVDLLYAVMDPRIRING